MLEPPRPEDPDVRRARLERAEDYDSTLMTTYYNKLTRHFGHLPFIGRSPYRRRTENIRTESIRNAQKANNWLMYRKLKKREAHRAARWEKIDELREIVRRKVEEDGAVERMNEEAAADATRIAEERAIAEASLKEYLDGSQDLTLEEEYLTDGLDSDDGPIEEDATDEDRDARFE